MGGGHLKSIASGGVSRLKSGEELDEYIDPLDLAKTRKKNEAKKQEKEQVEAQKKQEVERQKQEKLIAEAKAREDTKAADRKARLKSGRGGLLTGSATGVAEEQKSDTLGG